MRMLYGYPVVGLRGCLVVAMSLATCRAQSEMANWTVDANATCSPHGSVRALTRSLALGSEGVCSGGRVNRHETVQHHCAGRAQAQTVNAPHPQSLTRGRSQFQSKKIEPHESPESYICDPVPDPDITLRPCL